MTEPLRVFIVDDEPPARERLAELLEDCRAEVPNVSAGEAANGVEALARLPATAPDVVLVDVHMPGMNGIEFARHLQKLEHPPAVIFVTAFDQYAVQAFEVNALDYLLKPVRAARLATALIKAAVRAGNPGGGVRFYPGSPSLIGAGLRRGDRYVACELRDDDVALLRETLAPFPGATVLQSDGFAAARHEASKGNRLFILIDPPFERGDDYARIAETVAAALLLDPDACIAVWLPLKDLETFDAFLRSVEPAGADLLVVESRLKPLTDPMKMNGCAMVIANAPAGLDAALTDVSVWVAGRLGEAGPKGEVWHTRA